MMSKLKTLILRAFAPFFEKQAPWWPGITTMTLGGGLLLIGGTDWLVDLRLPDMQLQINRTFADELPEVIRYAIVALGAVLTLFGGRWAWISWRREDERKRRGKNLIIELRGLRNTIESPLIEAVPAAIKGVCEQVLMDIRQGISDGKIENPAAALETITTELKALPMRFRGRDRQDVTIIYGGLAPVPFTFLAGAWLDDEGKILVMDWDRHADCWRMSDKTDDKRRFRIAGQEPISGNIQEVALVVSASYQIQKEDVRRRVGGMPIISMTLLSVADGAGWSLDQHRALGKQFFDVVKKLGGSGVRRIHLFLAAENRLVFHFGRLYDTRNLPEIAVYQYQRECAPPHTWAILLTANGVKNAEILDANPVKSPSQTANR